MSARGKRIAIVGNSGSGKSTLARRLSAGKHETLDLDTIYWEPDQIAVRRDIGLALADVREFCGSRTDWIVEGCYASLIEAALSFGPELIFLDPGPEQCVMNCRARPWEPHKYPSKKEQDSHLPALLEWVASYYERDGEMSHSGHQALYARYSGPKRLLARFPSDAVSE